MSDMDNWQAAQYADECERLRRIVEALEAAERAGTPSDEIQLLAQECGAGNYYKESK